MDPSIRKYADALFESARMDSARTLREDRVKALQEHAARNRNNLPLSGVDIQAIARLYDAHIERCMVGRFESFEQAYAEAGRVPSGQEFINILDECKAVRILEIGHSARSIREFITSRGPVGFPVGQTEAGLENSSAYGHDRVLQRWKIWKTKVELKQSTAIPEDREKRRDALLPVYDRSEFNQDVPILISSSTNASPAVLLFMDLDKFKSINDGPGGHAAGDRALKNFSETLLRVCGGKGSVYRYGGDELCVLLPNHGLDEGIAVAERIRREVRAIETEELPDGLSTSIGLACFPESTTDTAKLVPLADKAMYAAKKAGGNRISRAENPNEGGDAA